VTDKSSYTNQDCQKFMSSVRIKVSAHNRVKKSAAQALPLPVSTLLARISYLEERLSLLEKGGQNGHASANGHANGHGLNGHSLTVNGKPGHNGGLKHKRVQSKVVAAISAAVAVALDRPYRIVSMAPIEVSSGHSACPWALHGRMSLHEMRSTAAWLRR
jgi:hypothetical protein